MTITELDGPQQEVEQLPQQMSMEAVLDMLKLQNIDIRPDIEHPRPEGGLGDLINPRLAAKADITTFSSYLGRLTRTIETSTETLPDQYTPVFDYYTDKEAYEPSQRTKHSIQAELIRTLTDNELLQPTYDPTIEEKATDKTDRILGITQYRRTTLAPIASKDGNQRYEWMIASSIIPGQPLLTDQLVLRRVSPKLEGPSNPQSNGARS